MVVVLVEDVVVVGVVLAVEPASDFSSEGLGFWRAVVVVVELVLELVVVLVVLLLVVLVLLVVEAGDVSFRRTFKAPGRFEPRG